MTGNTHDNRKIKLVLHSVFAKNVTLWQHESRAEIRSDTLYITIYIYTNLYTLSFKRIFALKPSNGDCLPARQAECRPAETLGAQNVIFSEFTFELKFVRGGDTAPRAFTESNN